MDEIADACAQVDGVADPDFVRGLAGLDRFAARKAIVAELEALGLLEKIEKHTHQVPHGDRCGVPIEPLADRRSGTVDAETLAQPAIKAVENGQDRLRAEAVGEHLLRVDAQHPALVHLPPALVGPPHSRPGTAPDGDVFVEETEAEAKAAARARITAATSS